jgi:hypothetical protein
MPMGIDPCIVCESTWYGGIGFEGAVKIGSDAILKGIESCDPIPSRSEK